jgi:integrase
MGVFRKMHRRQGVEFFYIDFRDQRGKRKREKAGTTSDQAKRLLRKRLGEVTSGTYVDPKDAGREAGPTFTEFADRFMKDYGSLRRSTYYEHRVKVLKDHFLDQPLQEITRADLDAFARARADRVGPSTLRKDLIVLGTVFKRAVRWGVLDANPASDLDKPSEPRHRARYLSQKEYRSLREAAPAWLRPMLRLAVVTGFRLKELAGVRWDDVDREAGILHVSEDNKTGRPRAVPIGETAGQVLAGQVRHVKSAYVFLDSTGQPYAEKRQRNRISQTTRALMKDQGIEGASFHTLRHTAGSWAAQAGESGVTIARFLGHAAASAMTDRYMHLQPHHFAGVVAALDRAEKGMDTQKDTQADLAVEPEKAKVVSSSGSTGSTRTGR